MTHNVRKSLSILVVFLMLMNNFGHLLQTKAVGETTTVVDLEIDDDVDGFSTEFDNVDRFSEHGIAKVSKLVETVLDDDGNPIYDIYKFGLLKLDGTLVQEVEFDEISDFNSDFYSVKFYGTEEDNYWYREGLVSKVTGETVLDTEYNWIPDLEPNTLMTLYKTQPSNNGPMNVSELKYYNANTKSFTTPEIPDEVSSGNYDSLWVNPIDNDLVSISAWNNQTESQLSWLADKQGNALNDDLYTYIQGYNYSPTKTYLAWQIATTENVNGQPQTTYEAGLFKKTISGSNVVLTDVLDSTIDYQGVWIDQDNERAQAWYQDNSGNYYGQLLNFSTDNLVQDTLNQGWTYSINSTLSAIQNCNQNGCQMNIYLTNDPNKTSITGGNINYSYAEAYNDQYIILSKYSLGTSYSNVLVKSGSNYFIAFDEDLEGYTTIYNDIVITSQWSQSGQKTTAIDVSNLTSQIDVSNSPSRVYAFEKMNTWYQPEGNFLRLTERVSENTYSNIYIDTINNRVVKNGVNSINENWSKRFGEDTIYGGHSSNTKSFIYSTSSSNFDLYQNIVSDFTDNGYIVLSDGIYSQIVDKNGYIHLTGVTNLLKITDNLYEYQLSGQTSKSIIYLKDDFSRAVKYENYTSITYGEDNYVLLYLSTASSGKYQFVQNGALVTALNTAVTNASSVQQIVDGKILFYDGDYKMYDLVNPYTYNLSSSLNGYTINGIVGGLVKTTSGILKVSILDGNLTTSAVSTIIPIDTLTHILGNTYKYSDSSKYGFAILAGSTLSKRNDLFDTITPNINNSYFDVVLNGDKGLADGLGNIIIETEFVSITLIDDFIKAGLIPANSNTVYTLFNLNGENLLNNQYYQSIGSDMMTDKLVSVRTSNGIDYVYEIGEHSGRILDNTSYYANEHPSIPGFYVYGTPQSSSNSTQGLIDGQGNIVVSVADGYNYVNYDSSLDVLVGMLNNYGAVALLEMDGDVILEGDYIFNYSGTTGKLAIDSEGNILVDKHHPTLYQSYQNNGETQYAKVTLKNLYDLETRSFIYSDFYYNRQETEDSLYYKIGNIAEEVDSDFQNGNRANFYVKNQDNTYTQGTYLIKEGIVSKNGAVVIPLGSYGNIMWTSENYVQVQSYSNSGSQYMGLVRKDGTVIQEPNYYNSIQYFSKDNLYSFSKMDVYLYDIENPIEDTKIQFNYQTIFNASTNHIASGFDSIMGDLFGKGYATVLDSTGYYMNYPDCEQCGEMLLGKWGMIDKYGNILLPAEYDVVREFNEQGISLFGNLKNPDVPYEYSYGLLGHDGIIVDNDYDSIETTFTRRNTWEPPVFDKDGYVLLVNNPYDYLNRREGLADKNGVVFEPEYKEAYYLEGYYYLKNPDNTWKIISKANPSDLINITVEDERDVTALQLLDDYIIVTSTLYNEFGSYDEVGVLKRSDMSTYLDYEYSSIYFDTTLNQWTLKRYNSAFNSYQSAVMNEDKSFLVPFGGQYDTISDYVGDYAVGQSGTKAVEQTVASLFSLNIFASEDDFILDIIDENGYAIGDVSDDFESASFMGIDEDGNTKALVVQDGVYYVATLNSTEVDLIDIASVSILESSVSMNIGDIKKLSGVISPSNNNAPKKSNWSSSNENVVVVDGKGNLKALASGTATITYSVNEFSDSMVVTVNGPTRTESTSSISYSSTVLSSSTTETKSNTTKVSSDVSNLLNLDSQPTKQEVTDIVEALVEDIRILESLSDEEVYKIESWILEAFSDQIIVENSSSQPLVFEGLISQLPLSELLGGKEFDLKVNLSNTISQADESVFSDFASSQQFDTNLNYAFDFSFGLTIDGEEVDLSNLDKPVKVTLGLPEAFKGIGTLEIVRIHDANATILPVTINDNQSFSFESDQFSSFILVKAERISITEKITADDSKASYDFIWLILFGGIIFIISLVIYYLNKK